jgi:hypothetical protein
MYSKSTSRIFFFCLAIFFIITAPVIIFYALGYRYNTDKGIFIYGGSITIKSNPQTVNVLIDGKSVPQRKINFINNSYHIDGIRPGIHKVEVSADGYSQWSKTAEVHSGVSTEFWNILLTKNTYEITPIPTTKTDRFFSSPKNDLVALVHQSSLSFSVSLFNIADNTDEEFFSSDKYSFTSNKKENVEWSPQEHKILIPVEKDKEKNYFIVDTKTKEATKLTDIAKLDDLKNARWDTDNKNILYFISQNNLYQINTANPAEILPVAENISDYDLSGSKIYIFKRDSGIIYRLSNGNFSDIKQITTSPPQDMTSPEYWMTVYDDKRIVLINSDSGKLYIFNEGELDTYFRELGQEIQDVQFSNDGKKILFWTDREISAYFTRNWDVQPVRKENEILNITRYSQPIRNPQWLKDYEHIIFLVNNEFKVIELDHRDRHIGMNVMSNLINNSEIVTDFSRNRIYITHCPDDLNFCFIKFPEPIGFFGN